MEDTNMASLLEQQVLSLDVELAPLKLNDNHQATELEKQPILQILY